jgi:aspartate--ammonia ligase
MCGIEVIMYKPALDLRETEKAIKLVKDTFERLLAEALHLERISAPLFVTDSSGLNDDLNGVERPVSFDLLDGGEKVSVVQSLAKWKRAALHRYGFEPGVGLYTDMNAIRRDETMDSLHSVYVDLWDWERVITRQDRNLETLKDVVRKIVKAVARTKQLVHQAYSELNLEICEDVFFITTEELLQKYPGLSPKERENRITQEHKTVFLMQIGDKLANGEKHDGRAPDYDDWKLNGDILFWYEPMGLALEISSMGIRVDAESLTYQLKAAGCESRRSLPYHKALLGGALPLTIGGGIGQSRLCLLLLEKLHVGEVQVSVWNEKVQAECREQGIELL